MTGTNSKIKRTYVPFVNEITAYSIQMAAQDITNWRTAIDSARSVLNPRRIQLYTLYDIIKLDGHLDSVMDKRKMGITNKKVLFKSPGDANGEDELINTKILNTPWFNDFQGHSADAVPFGHSLIELVPDFTNQDIIKKAALINRQNVRPEYSFVCRTPYNLEDGIYYNDYKDNPANPEFAPYLLSVGGEKDYGKLMVAAQYVIYKRGGFGDWAQFAELFGMPFRVGKYDVFDPTTREQLKLGLQNMGGAGFAIIPKGAELQFHDNNHTGSADIFQLLVEACNQELSKIFLGQTMTTENGSSHSQSATHKEVEEEVNLNDMIRQEYKLNWDFKRKMRVISGFSQLEKGKFYFEKTIHIPLDKRIKIDMELSKIIPMAEEYFYQTYGVDVPAPGQKPIVIPKDTPPAEPAGPKTPEKKKLSHKRVAGIIPGTVSSIYLNACKACNLKLETLNFKLSAFDDETNRLAKLLYNGQLASGAIDPILLEQTADALLKAVTLGFYDGIEGAILSEADQAIFKSYTENIYLFSSAKTFDELKTASKLLFDENNQARSFSAFKNDFAALHKIYNTDYLMAEYNHAVASSQMGAAWQRIDKAGMLTYQTAEDDRVRPAHVALDKITLPATDTFWKTYYPPNGWNCRCDAFEVNTLIKSNIDENKLPTIEPMFRGNAGIDGVIFPDKHPYFDVSVAEREKINAAANHANSIKNK